MGGTVAIAQTNLPSESPGIFSHTGGCYIQPFQRAATGPELDLTCVLLSIPVNSYIYFKVATRPPAKNLRRMQHLSLLKQNSPMTQPKRTLVSLRRFPYPYKAALCICSDIDGTGAVDVFWQFRNSYRRQSASVYCQWLFTFQDLSPIPQSHFESILVRYTLYFEPLLTNNHYPTNSNEYPASRIKIQ